MAAPTLSLAKPSAEIRLMVVGAYALGAGLTLISIASLLGLGSVTVGAVPTHNSASGALTFGLTVGGLVATTYIGVGATIRGIFSATQRAEQALLTPPEPKAEDPHGSLHGALSPAPVAGELSIAPQTKPRRRS
jgi:hypothetical protein